MATGFFVIFSNPEKRYPEFMLSWTLILALFAQSPETEPLEGCKRCDYRGVQDCKKHKKDVLELVRAIPFCSLTATCEECSGTLLIPCHRCDGGPETKAREERAAEIQAWWQKEHPLEKLFGRKLMRAELEQFDLVFDVEELRNGKKKSDGRLFFLHLAHDIQKATDMLNQHFGSTPMDYRGKERMWFWDKAENHKKVMVDFLYSSSEGDYKMLGKDPTFSVHTHDRTFQGDAEDIHSLGIHNAVHLLLSNLDLENWIGDQGGGWFDAGAAHWYEEKFFDRCIQYCIDEATIPPNYHNGEWRPPLYKLVKKQNKGLLPDLFNQHTGTLTEEQHAISWSVYDWMVAMHPDKLRDFLQGYKRKTHSRELFKKILDLDIIEVEQQWRAWVEEHYKPKPGKKRRRN